jgi:hypothetical protein
MPISWMRLSARLPPAFGLFYSKIGNLDQKLTLPPEMAVASSC